MENSGVKSSHIYRLFLALPSIYISLLSFSHLPNFCPTVITKAHTHLHTYVYTNVMQKDREGERMRIVWSPGEVNANFHERYSLLGRKSEFILDFSSFFSARILYRFCRSVPLRGFSLREQPWRAIYIKTGSMRKKARFSIPPRLQLIHVSTERKKIIKSSRANVPGSDFIARESNGIKVAIDQFLRWARGRRNRWNWKASAELFAQRVWYIQYNHASWLM